MYLRAYFVHVQMLCCMWECGCECRFSAKPEEDLADLQLIFYYLHYINLGLQGTQQLQVQQRRTGSLSLFTQAPPLIRKWFALTFTTVRLR